MAEGVRACRANDNDDGQHGLDHDHILRHHIDDFLAKRQPPKTFCPSEVARALSRDDLGALDFIGWRDAMPAIRDLVWQLRDQGRCEVLQKGEVLGDHVRMEHVKGPIRVRRSMPE